MIEETKYDVPLLSDPKRNRVVTEVAPPPYKPLSSSLLFPKGDTVNWKVLREHLMREGTITKEDCRTLIQQTIQILKAEPNLIYIDDPVVIVGDIHGQYYDLLHIMEVGGDAETTGYGLGLTRSYLFLGDYVDRGQFGVEVLLLLYALKAHHPKSVILLRGNHESRQMTQHFNFQRECLKKFDLEIYNLFIDSFYCLPLACVVNKQFLAIHGGISPDLKSVPLPSTHSLMILKNLTECKRFLSADFSGTFMRNGSDILWSDPVGNEQGDCEPTFKPNGIRGCSYFFGRKALQPFLKRNKILGIIRAHESLANGYRIHKWSGSNGFPSVITVFSAPNYCDIYNNKGAVIKLESNVMNVKQYGHSKHPYHLPDQMDVFSWSVPYLCSKIIEMLIAIMKKTAVEEEEEDMNERPPAVLESVNRKEAVKNKIKALSKIMKVYRMLE